MHFIKYQEIENSDRKKFIDYIKSEGMTEGEFVVQEKAHGANLSFWYDGKVLKSAKRSGFIEGDFYEYTPVEEKYREQVGRLYVLLKEEGYSFEVLTVYGELIGGTYLHKEVPKDTSATKIQKGIFYTPYNDFYAFDVAIDGRILDCDTFNKVMEATGFLYAKTIFRGSFDECLKYPNKFQSQIPVWLGLPEIPDNICEGIVIKPVVPKYLSNKQGVMIKSKNEKWEEKATQRDRLQKQDQKKEFTAAQQHLLEEMEQFVTENRLRNVLSKIGPVKQFDFGRLLGEFTRDILNDFLKEFSEDFNVLDKKEQKQITRMLNQKCASLIRLHFQNIVDGTF